MTDQPAPPSSRSDRERAKLLHDSGDNSQEELDRERFRADQSFIAKFMMWVFGLSIGVTIVTIAVTPFLTPIDNKLIPLMLEIIKIAVVPMTALVIGYYLPKSGR